MNAEEKKALKELTEVATNLRYSMTEYKEHISTKVNNMEAKIDAKHLPLVLEDEIVKASRVAIISSIEASLKGYQSPLGKLVEKVILKNSQVLEDIIQDCFTQVINTEDFKEGVRQAFSHKVAKNLVGSCDGLFDKATHDLKQNPTFKAKLVMVVSNLVEDYNKGNL
jgi:hypothetical protein